MTPTLARMVAARANALRKPVRWFSVPQLFRYERQQRGRLREHFQLNMDIIGEPDVTADAELLAAAIDIMRALGLGRDDVVARVSDRRLLQAYLEACGVAVSSFGGVFAVIDKIDRQPAAVSAEKLDALGLGANARDAVLRIAGATFDMVREALDGTGHTRLTDDFERYLRALDALGVGDSVRVDLSIVRGLAYYTGIVFELFDAKGELRAICGGGRYDTLLQSLGGVDLPALGFGMGDVVLGELLRARGLLAVQPAGVDVWVAFGDEGDVTSAMRVASRLRARGRSVEYALGNQKLARQLKAAHAAGARETVVVATPELADGEAMVRRMADGGEEKVTLDAWIAQA